LQMAALLGNLEIDLEIDLLEHSHECSRAAD
jgi:hypothetical protein